MNDNSDNSFSSNSQGNLFSSEYHNEVSSSHTTSSKTQPMQKSSLSTDSQETPLTLDPPKEAHEQRGQTRYTFWSNFPFGWMKTHCIEWERRATVTVKYQAVLLALAAWTLLLGMALGIVLLRTAPTAENMVNLIINDPVQNERLAVEVVHTLKKLDAEGKLQKQEVPQPKAVQK